MMLFDLISPEQRELILKHLDLVLEANERMNLTRIISRDDALLLHIEDSLIGLEELEDAPSGCYGDLGTGGGYPGIPLAIVSGRRTILIDSRQKKINALNAIIAQLGLEEQISTFAGRAELLARIQPEKFTALTARALAKLPVLMELASPLLQRDGHLICYKAHLEQSEIDSSKRIEEQTGMKLANIRQVILGDDITRTIVTFKKSGVPTVKLPRQEGQAQAHPL